MSRLITVVALIVLQSSNPSDAGTMTACKWFMPHWTAEQEKQEIHRRIDAGQGAAGSRVAELIEEAQARKVSIEEAKTIKASDKEALLKRLDEAVRVLRDLDKKVIKGLREKRVWPTMTADQACLSWGLPDKVNVTTTHEHTWEQWIYHSGRSYLYFLDGILTSISQ
jgi:hypothetical protein